MSNTTVVQYTRTHSAAHVSQKRSDVILIMKMIRNQIEDGLRSRMIRELRVGIMRRRQEFLSTVVSGVLSIRMFTRERITESEEAENHIRHRVRS